MSYLILVIPKFSPSYLNHEELENVAKIPLGGINSFLINQFAISYSFQLHMMALNFDFLKTPHGMLNSPKQLQPHWTCKHINWIDMEFDFFIIVLLYNLQLNKNWCVNCTCPHWCWTWHHPYSTSNSFWCCGKEHHMFNYFVEFHSSIGLWFDQEMEEMHDLILKISWLLKCFSI